jgi:dihydroneopterin aldolase
MMIRINNLRLQAIVGVYDWEKLGPQDIRVDIELDVDGQAAAASDDLADAVDYAALCDKITEAVSGWRFALLEKLAWEILKIALDDKRVGAAAVEIFKPAALPQAESVSVKVSAERP